MGSVLSSVSIKNFKSIKELSFDCKKLNLFIGKPNVGKSNILEAMSLFALPTSQDQDITKFIRLKTMKNLFYDNVSQEKIEVKIFDGFQSDSSVTIFEDEAVYKFAIAARMNGEGKTVSKFSNSVFNIRFNLIGEPDLNYPSNLSYKSYRTPFRSYNFSKKNDYSYSFHEYLLPPDGRNLVTILQDNNNLFDEVQVFFEEYGLEMILDVAKNDFELQKRIDKRAYKYPFELISDTLQRTIFYLAAIESNHEAAIIFEEPEAHSFPPYINALARRIGMDETNQFFISTHSPYLLSALVEDIGFDDLNVFITYFEDYQTRVHSLDLKELREMIDDSVDAFSNLDRFMPQI